MRDARYPAPRRLLAPDHQADDEAPTVTTDLLARARTVVASRPAPPTRAAPDKGIVCGELARADGSSLVVAVKEYEGKQFVSLSVWSGGWPVKGKTVTVRPRELAQVIEGLCLAAERLS